MAPATSPKNTAHSTQRFVLTGRTTNNVALATAAIDSAQPMNAFAAYQIAGAARVAPVLKPYMPFGGTKRRMSGILTITSPTHDAMRRARVRSGSPSPIA